MASIFELVPQAQDLLSLEAPEAAAILLVHLNSTQQGQNSFRSVGRGNFFMEAMSPARQYPPEYKQKVEEKLMSAWVWLEREGLLLPVLGNHHSDFVFVSERGKSIERREDLDAYRRAALLPREMLHPAISTSATALFLRGLYDTVIFEAFREVEVAVRRKGGFTDSDVGVQLMRKAFHSDIGPLTDMTVADKGERDGLQNLFVGVMGYLKNPTSHRTGTIKKPEEAVTLLLFASYLLNLIDSL